jgi:hypothetical protein
MLISLPGVQDTGREVSVMDRVWKVLCLEAEATVEVIGLALFPRQAYCLRQEVPWRFQRQILQNKYTVVLVHCWKIETYQLDILIKKNLRKLALKFFYFSCSCSNFLYKLFILQMLEAEGTQHP